MTQTDYVGVWDGPVLKGSYQREDGIWVFERREFARERFPYEPGEHVVLGGPTTKGKTRVAFRLLEYVATPDLPAYVAVSKPKDPETTKQGIALDYRRVDQWPPDPKWGEILGKKPSGYLVWANMGNVETDVQKSSQLTADLIGHTYARGAKNHHAILVMDDTMVKAKILGLDGQMVTVIAMAGAMGIGLWVFIQKPTDSGRITLWAYENCTHLLLTKGGDARMLNRYAEIAGEHGPTVKRVVPTLRPYQFLYVNRPEGWVCIVEAE